MRILNIYFRIAKVHKQLLKCFLCRFEVLFVGAEAMIDMRPSREWIAEKTASWNFPVHMNVSMILHIRYHIIIYLNISRILRLDSSISVL